jgi:hypothetical protein
MPRPKRILSGDEYITKTEKMIGLPKKYPNLSKTEKMQYLPRFYYNNYEKIDDGFLDYIHITHNTIALKLDLRPDTAFGYPTWGSVFGGTDFINNNQDAEFFLFNSSLIYTFDFYYYLNENDTNIGYIYARSFWPYIGFFYDISEQIELKDNDKFGTTSLFQSVEAVPTYVVLNLYNTNIDLVKNTKVKLFNNNRAKVLDLIDPL